MKKINKKAVKYARSIHKHLPYPLPIGENDLIKAYIAGAVDFNGEVQDGPDWEQRRYEIARDCLAHIFPNTSKMMDVYEGKKRTAVWQAVDYADELITKLKEAGNE